MRIQNLTPFLVGYKVTSRRPPRPEMTVIVRGAFDLAPERPLRVPEGLFPLSQGTLRADVFREDDEERTGEVLYPSDFADWKPRAEAMLRGSCHPPGGQPVRECPVRFSVGAWSKLLYVVGPRVWKGGLLGASPGDPEPFTEMPLSYANAFGGPSHAPNPVGKGIDTADLPTVEHASARLWSKRDRPPPASFGPINPAWPPRAGKVGTQYGRSYKEKRAPFYAEDFDWSYFSAAPLDQQLEGYLQGDEEMSFQNLHPRSPLFSTRLPGRRIRAFVRDVEGRFREVRMVLDTLFADLQEEKLFLTWRGVDPVLETDLHDVRTVLAADEALGDAPLPESHYRDLLEAFERDPIGNHPAVSKVAREAWQALRREGPAEEPGGSAAQDPLDALLQDKLARLPAPQRESVKKNIAKLLDLPLPPGVDPRAALLEALRKLPANAGPATPGLDPGAMPRVPIGATLERIRESVEVVKRAAAAQGLAVPQIEKLEALVDDPRLRALDPSSRARGEPRAVPEEPGAVHDLPHPPGSPGKPGSAPIPPGRDLSGQDLSGRDLRGADLRGAKLDDAILTGAQLQGAKLGGASLVRAILADADLSEADLSEADLSLCNLAGARATGAVFRGARLDKISATKAVLTGAILAEARGEMPIFQGADLGGVDARGIALDRAMLDEVSVEGAIFEGARLESCRFLKARARGARFEGATIERTSFADADLREAIFVAARGERSIWLRAWLEGADLRYAILSDAHFTEARASAARFAGADLRRARFYRATLERADLSGSNLFGADLCKSVVNGASFAKASLYGAKLLDASREGCDFDGANLRGSALERT